MFLNLRMLRSPRLKRGSKVLEEGFKNYFVKLFQLNTETMKGTNESLTAKSSCNELSTVFIQHIYQIKNSFVLYQ